MRNRYHVAVMRACTLATILLLARVNKAESQTAVDGEGSSRQGEGYTRDNTSPQLPMTRVAQTGGNGASASVSHTDEGASQLEEVVVTARRREEVLQAVPIAATAYSGDQLKQESVKTVSDLQALVPSLQIQEASDDPQSIIVTMRGRRQDDATLAVDSSVSMNVDGLYIPRTLGMAGSLLDVARIEALRGPQGTLYGRNTTGGAIGIFTNDPTHDLSGSLDVTGGNFGAWNVIGIANIPISDTLDARFVAQRGANNGYAQNSSGTNIGSEDSQYYRAKLRWTGSDKWQAILEGHYESNSAGPQRGYVSGLVPAADGQPAGGLLTAELEAESAALRGGLLPNGLPATDANAVALLNQWIAAKSPWFEDNYIGGPKPTSHIGRWDIGLNVSGDLSENLKLHSISGIQSLHRSVTTGPQFPVYIVDEAPYSADTYYSQELQLLGTLPYLNWVVGVYGGDELGQDNQKIIFMPYVLGFDAPVNDSGIHNSTLAGYGQATWEFVPSWHLTGGARYTGDWRRIDETALLGTPPTLLPAIQCLVPAPSVVLTPPGAAQCPRAFGTSSARPTWLLSIDHELIQGVLAYAKAATGYRSGGSNAESGANDIASFDAFKPETNLEYEIGVKSELLNRRLRVNIALYDDKYSNLQVRNTFLSPSGFFTTVENNAATATIEGMETEAAIIITQGLRMQASAAFTDAHYDSFPDIDPSTGLPIDRSHEPFVVPKWTWSLGANYTRATPIGELSTEVDYDWKSAVNMLPTGTLLVQQNTQGSYGLLDARADLHIAALGLDVALFGKNLTNKAYIDQGITSLESAGFDFVFLAPPRTYGIEVIKKFGHQ